MNFKSWSLYNKIWLLVGVLLTFSIVSIVYSVYALKSINATIDKMANVHYEARGLASKITDQQRFMVIQTRNLIIENDLAKISDINKAFDDAGVKQNELLAKIEPLLVPEALSELKTYKENRDKWFKVIDRAQELKSANNTDKAKELIFAAQAEILNGMLKTLDKVRSITSDQADKSSKEASSLVTSATTISLVLGAISALLSLVFAFAMIRGLRTSIQKIINSLAENARNVASASHQIAATAEELSQANTEQSASLEQTSASIEEMNSMVGKNSENAVRAAETTTESQEHAREGQEAVARMIKAMDEINHSNNSIMNQVEHSNKQITEIVEVIKEIGVKTKVINDIVFQTKLLSFNASVEAARAGEQGKGFAVVAEEVGNLASMSGNAAKEISDLLENSIHKVETIVHETKAKVGSEVSAGKEKVKNGTEIAHQCGGLLDTIVHEVSSISKMAEEISGASKEQAQGVGEITKAITQLETVTQQNSASSEQTASAAEELSAQAQSLNMAVQELVSTIEGGHKQKIDERPSVEIKKIPEKRPALKVVAQPVLKTAPMKKVVGHDAVPSADHEGFTDV